MAPLAPHALAAIRGAAAPFRGRHRHAVLLALASMLLLSGCVLSPLFQAPAAMLTGLAVLLGLAACGPGEEGGAGSGGGSGPAGPWVVRVDALTAGQPGSVVTLRGVDNGYADGLGLSLAVGDVRGDGGARDLVIGAPRTFSDLGPDGPYSTGRAYVVFGGAGLRGAWAGTPPANIEDVVDGGGFTLRTNVRFNRMGYSVAVAPNLKGDGHPAVLVGLDGPEGAGAVAAVYPTGASVSVEQGAGSSVLQIVNAYEVPDLWDVATATPSSGLLFNGFGSTVAALDLDGDGLTDLAAAAPATTDVIVCADVVYDEASGRYVCDSGPEPLTFNPGVFVVLGDAGLSNGAFDLDDPTPDFTGAVDSFTGVALATGRVNGDSKADLIIGALNPELEESSAGSVNVVFGAANGAIGTAPSALNGANGFTIVNTDPYASLLGWQVAAGDVNGDGLDDVVLSEMALVTPSGGEANAQALLPTGRVWVVFGQRDGLGSGTVDLAALPASQGFSITLPTFSLVDSITTGDLNGDGIQDVVVGSSLAMDVEQPNDAAAYPGFNGAVFVAFGSAKPASLTAAELSGSRGMVLLGPPNGIVGAAVAVGDLDGDGWNDLVVASPKGTYLYGNTYADPELTLTHRGPGAMLPYHGPGLVYIVFGPGDAGVWPGSLQPAHHQLHGLPFLAAGPTALEAEAPMQPQGRRFLARLRASLSAASVWKAGTP